MHEVSLAENIAEVANNALLKHNKNIICEIVLDIGMLTCVEPEALQTALDAFKHDVRWIKATYVINEIQGIGECRTCGKQMVLNDFFSVCDHCQSSNIEILSGKEFKIKSITMK